MLEKGLGLATKTVRAAVTISGGLSEEMLQEGAKKGIVSESDAADPAKIRTLETKDGG